ncbi:MAG: hypothetical protein ABFS32_03790 [Bacteroidota bacterium]
MRIKILLLIIPLFVSVSALGQKYRDVFPRIVAADDENAFELLNAYLEKELDHPNANLRMAIIYVNRYKEVDVLREQEKALALAGQARNYLTKSKVLITDREIKRNEAYYTSLFDPGVAPGFTQLVEYIDSESIVVNEFIEKLPPLYKSFTSSVEKYDEAVKNFAEIVGTYKSLKELYLLYDKNLAVKLLELKSNYDSTKVCFDIYLGKRSGIEVNAVKQSYTEKPIKIYRLDGLVTQINFLQEKIALWDYAAWVDSVNLFVEKEIYALRDDLEANEAKLKAAVNEVEKTQDPESFKVVYADKELVFNLMKFDYKNAIVPLITYQEFQQQFVIDQNRRTYFDTATIAIERKLAYYNDVLYESKEGDSIIAEFESRFSIEQLKRHQAFVDKNFGDANAMKQYMAGYKRSNQKVFLNQVAAIREGINSISENDSIGNVIKNKKATIPLHIVKNPVNSLPLGRIKTQFILPSADESIYIAGTQITDTKLKNHEIAIVKLSPARRPVWIKNLDVMIDDLGTRTNHYLGDAKLTAEGIAFLIRSVALDGSKAANTIIHMTEKGEIKFSKQLQTEQVPRELVYIESSNVFITSYFGDNAIMDPAVQSGLSIIAVNGLGESIWNYRYNITGDYLQMVNTQNNLLISGNYSTIVNKAGRKMIVKNGTNAFVISLNMDGALNDIKCFESTSPYKVDRFFKVNDKCINLLGPANEHIIFDSKLKTIHNSLTTN